jgi:hypothetical protein
MKISYYPFKDSPERLAKGSQSEELCPMYRHLPSEKPSLYIAKRVFTVLMEFS